MASFQAPNQLAPRTSSRPGPSMRATSGLRRVSRTASMIS